MGTVKTNNNNTYITLSCMGKQDIWRRSFFAGFLKKVFQGTFDAVIRDILQIFQEKQKKNVTKSPFQRLSL